MTHMVKAFATLLGAGMAFNASGLLAAEYNGGPAAIIQCPAKGRLHKTFELSTGIASWMGEGPGMPNGGKARATPVDEASFPKDWAARLPGAAWVQAMPVMQAIPRDAGDFAFTLSFQVKKARRMPRFTLEGAFIADDTFQLKLAEPAPPNDSIGRGIGRMNLDNVVGRAPQDEVQNFTIAETGDGSGKPLGHRPGLYTIRIDVQNSEGRHAALGMLARIKLVAACGSGK